MADVITYIPDEKGIFQFEDYNGMFSPVPNV